METATKPRIGLTGNELKLIAMLAMLTDHVGLYLFPDVLLFRMIGRIAFPIFAFMIAEGCQYTRNRFRYLAGIAGLGILCQIVVTVVTRSLHMGILLTFSLSIAIIYTTDAFLAKRTLVRGAIAAFCVLAAIFISAVLPYLLGERNFKVDYDVFGVMLPVLLYYTRGRLPKLLAATILLFTHAILSNYVQLCALFAIPLLFFYDGTRGRARMKYLFYIFYPLHLAVIYLIKILISSF